MRLSDVLFTQGFGTRRACKALVRSGAVALAQGVVDDPDHEVEPVGLVFQVHGQAWPYHAPAYVLLHKPVGTECSRQPGPHPSVLTLLPEPLCHRVQPVGRLDQDTSGLLLLTDDGPWLHRVTSPKHHVPKVYEARTARPVTPSQIQMLLAGVVLRDDPAPVRALHASATGEHHLQLVVTQGRYHLVRRMVAAVGNHVEALHRSAFGALRLPADLAAGQWRWLPDAPRAVAGE